MVGDMRRREPRLRSLQYVNALVGDICESSAVAKIVKVPYLEECGGKKRAGAMVIVILATQPLGLQGRRD